MSVSVFDHPFLRGLVGETGLAPLFEARADVAAMLRFEAALAEAQADEGLIPRPAAAAIAAAAGNHEADMTALRAGLAKDGVVVPALLAGLRADLAEAHRPYLHFGATSQDVIDTGLALRLKAAIARLDSLLGEAVAALAELETRDGAVPVMAHTRMQAALPVTAARKIGSWRAPLQRHRERLQVLRPEVEMLHLGGAVGTLEAMDGRGPAVAARMTEALDLAAAGIRHSERDGLVAFASLLSLMTGSLGKMGQDVALAAQSEMGEIVLATGGGSSAMAHKKNPVAAETLVTLARFNATLVSGLHGAMIHENERSGAAWTLEWMLLPQMVLATGAALSKARTLAETVSFTARD